MERGKGGRRGLSQAPTPPSVSKKNTKLVHTESPGLRLNDDWSNTG
jgi:hypothetical protein